MRTHSVLSILAGIGITLTACSATQGPAVSPTTVEHEQALFEAQAKAQVEQQTEEQRARVQKIGNQLLTGIPNAPQIEFAVIPDAERINAGTDTKKIAVTSGLLQFVQSDDELAAVLAHLIAHVMQGHVTQGRVTRADMWHIPTAEETDKEAAPGSDEKREKTNLEQILSHQFTQRQELEADALGLRYLGTAGYNPQIGGTLWERWAGAPPQPGTADLLISHPSSPERSALTRKILAKLPSSSSSTSASEPASAASVASVDAPSQPTPTPEPVAAPLIPPPSAPMTTIDVSSRPAVIQKATIAPEPAATPEIPRPPAPVAPVDVSSQPERAPELVSAPEPVPAPQPEIVPAPAVIQQPAVVPAPPSPPAPRQSLAELLEGLDQLYYHGHISAREYWRQRDALVQHGSIPPPLPPQLGVAPQESASRATEVVTPQIASQSGSPQPPSQNAMGALLDEFKKDKITLEEYRKRRDAIERTRE